MTLYCPKDYNLGDRREEQCNVGGIPCPDPLEMDPNTVVQVTCGPCNGQWGIPIADVMKNKVHRHGSCQLQTCAAKVVLPKADSNTKTQPVVPPALNQGEAYDPNMKGKAAQSKPAKK